MEKRDRCMDASACVHCGRCRENCTFLDKYGIEIGDTEKLRELAYHCFLCGTCSSVCPLGIDGREIILNMRRERAAANGQKPDEKGYGWLLWEKERYRFRNYRNGTGKSVLFPGCNFPSFYPRTTKYLAKVLKEKAGIGTVFDCCGKPVAELGLARREEEILKEIEGRLKEAGVEEIIVLCPNCYHFFKGRLDLRIVSIYKKLKELGIGSPISENRSIFFPCPDRQQREFLEELHPFLPEEPQILEGVQCCGLGGCAGVREPHLAAQMPGKVQKEEPLYTYCASCSGALTRKGFPDAAHLLPEILGRPEAPDCRGSLLNRVKAGYWRNKES